MASNQTHSICACNHLTTFALLADFDPLTLDQQQQHKTTHNIQDQQLAAISRTSRFHLDSALSDSYASGELVLAAAAASNGQQQMRAINLAKVR